MSEGEPVGADRETVGTSCPSARHDMPGARLFGVVSAEVDGEPRVAYLSRLLPASPDVMAAAGPGDPGAVFRIGAPCAGGACSHFAAGSGLCTLARRTVQHLPVVVDTLPRCALRPTCVWWHQEGVAACRRCPQVVSQPAAPNVAVIHAADPSSPI